METVKDAAASLGKSSWGRSRVRRRYGTRSTIIPDDAVWCGDVGCAHRLPQLPSTHTINVKILSELWTEYYRKPSTTN